MAFLGTGLALGDAGATGPRRAPRPRDDSAVIAAGEIFSGNLLDNDAGPVAQTVLIEIAGAPAGIETTLPSGARITAQADGAVVYDTVGAFDAVPLGESASETVAYRVRAGDVEATAYLTVVIDGVNSPPTIVGPPPTLRFTEGAAIEPVDLSLLFLDVSDTLSYEIGTLPEGLIFDPETGVLSGAPAVAFEDWRVEVRARDAANQVAALSASLSADAAPTLNPPAAVPAPPAAVWTAETPIAPYALSQLFAGGAPERYQLLGVLPDGVYLDAADWSLKGTPMQPEPVAAYDLVIRAINADGQADATVSVSVDGFYNQVRSTAPVGFTQDGTALSVADTGALWRVSTGAISGQRANLVVPVNVEPGGDYAVTAAINFLPGANTPNLDGRFVADVADTAYADARMGAFSVTADGDGEAFQTITTSVTVPAAGGDPGNGIAVPAEGYAGLHFIAWEKGAHRILEIEQETLDVRGPGPLQNAVTGAPTIDPPAAGVEIGVATPVPNGVVDLMAVLGAVANVTRWEIAPASDPLPPGLSLDQGVARTPLGAITPRLFLRGTPQEGTPASTSLVLRGYNDAGAHAEQTVTLTRTDTPDLLPTSQPTRLLSDVTASDQGSDRWRVTLGASRQDMWASIPVTVEPHQLYRLQGVIRMAGLSADVDYRPAQIRVGRTQNLSIDSDNVWGTLIASRAVFQDEDAGAGVSFDLYFTPDQATVFVGVRLDGHDFALDYPNIPAGAYVELQDLSLARVVADVPSATPAMMQTINYRGVIFTLDAPHLVGLRADGWGRPWALNPAGGDGLQITQIWPPSQQFGRQLYNQTSGGGATLRDWTARWVHGAERDRDNGVNNDRQGFDGRDNPLYGGITLRPYDDALNVDPGRTGQPIIFAAGEEGSISKAVSLDFPGQRDRLDQRVTLDVVAAQPAADALAPDSGAASKAAPAALSDLDMSLLPSLPTPAGASVPNIDAALASFATDHDPWNNTFPNNGNVSTLKMGGFYTRGIARLYEQAWLSLLSADVDPVKKRALYGLMVQHGLHHQRFVDAYAAAPTNKSLGVYPAGHNTGMRKPFYALAAFALDDAALKTAVAFGPSKYRPFGLDRNRWRVTPSLIDGAREPFPGRILRDYRPETLGMPEWGQTNVSDRIWLNHPTSNQDGWGAALRDIAYRGIDVAHSFAMTLAMRLIGDGAIMTQWDNDAVFDYADRAFFHHQRGRLSPETAPADSEAWWLAYRQPANTPVATHNNGLAYLDGKDTPELRPMIVGQTYATWIDLEDAEFGGQDYAVVPDSYALTAVYEDDGVTAATTAWPSGVSLNTSTGVISTDGTQTATPLRFYEVTGSVSGGGSAVARVAMAVEPIRLTAPEAFTPSAGRITGRVTPVGGTGGQAGGTLYWVITASHVAPTPTQVIAGQDHTGAAAPASGASQVAALGNPIGGPELAGVPQRAVRYIHWLWESDGGHRAQAKQSAAAT